MTAPTWLNNILGWRGNVPNVADKDSPSSVALAGHVMAQLGNRRVSNEQGQTLGTLIEQEVELALARELPLAAPHRSWSVARNRQISHYRQYEHLARLQELAKADEDLRAEYGGDYLIKPDVAVGVNVGDRLEMLHAAVSCKFTIRSDRVQNVRHEFLMMTKHRRGRNPHCVSVTSEPLPSRLASIARGTGEVDRVYHLALGELMVAAEALRGVSASMAFEADTLRELVSQRRLAPWDDLVSELAQI